ncbi:MAG TPA: hypothetical protein VN962_19420, partial [Polyangia bacterium]|nr:hypothetical protein [Polyangia bacterium]
MKRPAWLTFDLRPLGHPIWWSALAVLAANDHILKGAGVLPGWLTGKLSDFAFLIVAPVLVACLLPAAWRPRRAVALIGTIAPFAAGKLSPAFSHALVAAVGHLGIAWRLWTDPTDLLALLVVPLTTRVMNVPPAGGVLRRARERGAVVLGALGCVATSALPTHPHNPFLLNAAGQTTSVTITWLLRAIPCDGLSTEESLPGSPVPADLAPSLAASLTAGDLDDPITVDLSPGQVAALDGPPPPGTSPAGVCSANTDWTAGTQCVGAILEAPAAGPVLMVAVGQWRESDHDNGFFSCSSPPPATSRCQPSLDPAADPGPDAVTLKSVGGVLQFVAGAKVRLAPVDLAALAARTSPPGGCRELRQQYEMLLQPAACTSDADCVAVQSLAIPGAPPSCGVDVTVAGAQTVARLDQAWSSGCVRGPWSGCTVPQPAVCRAGACGPACPGEQVPSCPLGCSGGDDVIGGPCNPTDPPCVRTDGLVCRCAGGHVTCSPAAPTSATCPLICQDWPGGGSYVNGQILHPPLDGGIPGDAAAGDGGAPDAR